ncbi:Gfo/Idh/MocA family oxidoreductase, partial [Microbacterium gubbeenense]
MRETHLLAGYDGGSPRAPRPIVIIGAGGIVRDAHLPAYKKARFPVWGIVDIAREKAQALADQYGIRNVFASVAEAVDNAPDDAVYDLALMPEHVPDALEALPEGSAVLIQKPLGHSL